MTTLIERQYEFNIWANTEIFTICAGLDEAQLATTIHGTFGRIQPTIVHIVRAEGNYLVDLGGDALWDDDMAWDDIPIAQLAEMALRSGKALRDMASTIDPDKKIEYTEEGKHHEFPAWLVVNQAINHGIEHRTHLRLLLTKLNVPHPTLDFWDYAESLGELQIREVG